MRVEDARPHSGRVMMTEDIIAFENRATSNKTGLLRAALGLK
jgi:hypothetical protein